MMWELYFAFLRIGAFSIGGGYASFPLIKHIIVDTNKWLSNSEFTDILTISQMTPGPIALNAATFVGVKHFGQAGAAAATLGFITVPLIVVSIFTYVYFKYNATDMLKRIFTVVRPAVLGLIAAACASLVVLAVWGDSHTANYRAVLLFALSIISVWKLKVSPIAAILLCAVIGIFLYK
ncbi:chromate transporter [Clostridia bacterium]|nr:chromate transporter [Clostridia bacterium]